MRSTMWFLKSKFALMESFLPELRAGGGALRVSELETRFLRATRHAKRVERARGVVTALLALGVIATASASFAQRASWVPPTLAGDVTFWLTVLDRVALVAGSISVVLLVARLAFDRYLERIETTAAFVAMQIATAAAATGPSGSPRGA